MVWRKGFFCQAKMRPGGFTGYEQIAWGSNKIGSLNKKPVSVVADSPYVKVTVPDKYNKQPAERFR